MNRLQYLTIADFLKLYSQCEQEKLRYSDDPVTLDYFIDWLETEFPEAKNVDR